MYQLNNVDVIILIVIAISALIALNRGLIKEVLSIVGWFLATFSIIYFLPICLPFAKNFIANGIFAGILTSVVIFTVFFVFWIFFTSSIVGKIRTSKLNGLDRFLGLFFGVMRAFLLVVLFNIMVSWIIPVNHQSDSLTESKYYNFAGKFAKPLEELIPEETIALIQSKTNEISKETSKSDNKKDETDILFEKLARPQIKKAVKDIKQKEDDKNTKGYKDSERSDLDRLIDSVSK